MKITVRQLRRVIAEEVQRVLEISNLEQGRVHYDPDLDKTEINSFNLGKYRWQLANDASVRGTFDLTEGNYNAIMQTMATNPGENLKVNVFNPRGKIIEYAHIKDGANNYFVSDTHGLARYFAMKMPDGPPPGKSSVAPRSGLTLFRYENA